MKILFVASEAYPLVKTGGLADVVGALPAALAESGEDIRIVLPAYYGVAEKLLNKHSSVTDVGTVFGWHIRLIEGYMPDSGIAVSLVDCPFLFERAGNPYSCSNGCDWPDNGERFAVLSMVATIMAVGDRKQEWAADVIHANDWQTGLVPAYLKVWRARRENNNCGEGPVSVFTVHNLSFQGRFPQALMEHIGLPRDMFSINGIEFYGDVSYLKSGLYYSDHITTVSPTYAYEIRTDVEAGQGLQGLLLSRVNDLTGILNGEDVYSWDPSSDPTIHYPFTVQQMHGKILDKTDLQREFGLKMLTNKLLFAVISRLTEQKGIDLILEVVPTIMERGGQLVVLGAGDSHLEKACLVMASRYPEQLAVHIGMDETLAHRIQAGSDVLLMPSRFEPCGLSQMYAMRYGTLPLVRRTGGLADTIVDAKDLEKGTGFVFETATLPEFLAAINRAFELYQNKEMWQLIQRRAMRQDFSWHRSAERYLQLYYKLRQEKTVLRR